MQDPKKLTSIGELENEFGQITQEGGICPLGAVFHGEELGNGVAKVTLEIIGDQELVGMLRAGLEMTVQAFATFLEQKFGTVEHRAAPSFVDHNPADNQKVIQTITDNIKASMEVAQAMRQAKKDNVN